MNKERVSEQKKAFLGQ